MLKFFFEWARSRPSRNRLGVGGGLFGLDFEQDKVFFWICMYVD